MKRGVVYFCLAILLVSFIVFGNMHFNKKTNIQTENSNVSSSSKTEDDLSYLKEDVFIYAFNNQINIYIKGSNEKSDRYIGYNIKQLSKDLNPDVTSSNYNVWVIDSVNEYQRTGKESFLYKNNIVTSGEWDLAIKETSANDFIGGSLHGDEITTKIDLLVDGDKVNLGEVTKKKADNVELIIQSDLYRDNTVSDGVEKVAQHFKKYIFDPEGLVVEQKVEFIETLQLERSYLAMLPILRKSNGETGEQVTDTIVTNYDNQEYSVAEEGFSIPEITFVDASKVKIFGKESGFSATVEILDRSPNDTKGDFFLANSPLYNKLYFSFVGDDYIAEEGEVWTQTTNYKIDTTN